MHLLSLVSNRLARHASPVAPLDLSALVGPAGWARLPAAVQRRFATAHADATYVGRVDLHCSRIGRLHAFLSRAFGSPLTSLCADAVPTVVRIAQDGRGGVVWDRGFHASPTGAPDVVRSTKQTGRDGRLFERTDGGLGMALDVFEEGGALVFQSRRFSLDVGPLRLPLPALLGPGTCRVTHTDLGAGLFRFTLDMRHPLWGHTFHQSGVFVDSSESAQ